MPSNGSDPLLRELLDYLVSQSGWRSLWRPRTRPAKLITRLRAVLAATDARLQFPDVIDATRQAWAGDLRVRIDGDSRIAVDRDGLWVAAWLLAGDTTAARSPEAITAALADLPPLRREIFRLYRAEHLDHDEIASRLDISADMARSELVAAFVTLDRALHGQEA